MKCNRNSILDSKKQVYQDLRHQKAFAVDYKHKVKMSVIKTNKKKRDLVKEEEDRIKERLRKREEDKKKRNQLHYSMRVDDQRMKINQVDYEINAMEKVEKEILERLKNSQRMEQEAYKSLENAIKSSVEGTEWRKQVVGAKPRLPIKKYGNMNKTHSHSSSVYDQSIH